MCLLYPILDRKALLSATLILVISCMDYCNMLYMGLSLTSIWKLQLIKNVAARIILGSPGMAHVTPPLHELHWLQVCFWVQFKVLIITFKALHGRLAGYLQNHLCPIISAYPTRSGRKGLLHMPAVKEFQLVDSRKRLFSAIAPCLWNIFPPEWTLAPTRFPFGNPWRLSFPVIFHN